MRLSRNRAIGVIVSDYFVFRIKIPEIMRPVEQMYRNFCIRMAGACEDEANLYDQHDQLQDPDRQFIRVLRERCKQWRREMERLDAAYSIKTNTPLATRLR